MSQTKSIASRFREVILNGTWIANTNYQDQLQDVTWEQATTKLGGRHTIAELTFHIHYYIAGVLQVLKGGALEIRDQFSFDMPAIESPQDWEKLTSNLWRDAEEFAVEVEKLDDSDLGKFFVEEKYGDYRRSLEGMIEHSYYHLGQLALIKKMVNESTS